MISNKNLVIFDGSSYSYGALKAFWEPKRFFIQSSKLFPEVADQDPRLARSLRRGCHTPEENEIPTDDKDTAAFTNPLDHLSDEEYEKHLAAEAQAQLEAQFDAQQKEKRKL